MSDLLFLTADGCWLLPFCTLMPMKSVIVGTAGHIDHGKTALVRALTGIDTDRLEEEKRRGITIDLGFAHLELSGPQGELLRLGLVDVPGHERFVRNMLAGVGGIDMALLVVAADEGIKPQTREHFDICRLLGIQRGLTVVTKSDLVDAETLGVVRLELEEFLRGSFLDAARAPIVPVSALTGAGLDQLRRELARVAAEVAAKDSNAQFRLPVDRVFTMSGFGTVITGTLIAGSVAKEDEVEIFPGGERARVRGVQVHGEAAERAMAGQRTALNLAGVATGRLARGMVLAFPGRLRATSRVDASVTLLGSAKPLKSHAPVHFHAHAVEMIARVVPLDARQIGPGQTAYAQLRLEEPTLLLPGDRFILRQFSPMVTIGGGVVLDAAPRKATAQESLAFLSTLGTADDAGILTLRAARRLDRGLSLDDAVAETGWTRARVEAVAAAMAAAGKLARFGDVLVHPPAIAELETALLEALDGFHRRNPLVSAMPKEQLREEVGVPAEIFGPVLETLARERKIELAGDQVRAAGRGVVMKDEEAEAKATIERAFAEAGLKVPGLKEVLASLPVDRARAQKIVTLLLRERVLVKLTDDLVFHRDALAALRRSVAEYKTRSARIGVAQFKELAGISRKYAIPLLEYLDRERVTRRVGDERIIL